MASTSNLVSSAVSGKAGIDALPTWNSNVSNPQVSSSVDKFESALKLAQAPGTPIGLEGPSLLPVTASSVTNTVLSAPSDALQLDLSSGSRDAVKTYGQMDVESLNLENRRALQGLDFGSPAPENSQKAAVNDSPGGIILDGWSHLRSIFDKQAASLNSASSYAVSGTERLIATQIEMAKYSLLLDVTSKLTGKFTQGVDTLLKG